ncbi:MAG: hypothetical protein GX883_08655 [Firmicutes bacterium]|nr:hypothetical protein [Bacillota bacterium]
MREPAAWLGLLFLLLVLLYAGLNIVERGTAVMAAQPYRQEAFSVSHDSAKGLGFTLTFAGWTAHLYLDRLFDVSDRRQGGKR